MKPVINDKTVLRLQKATGLPVSRGVDKTINSMLDKLEELKASSTATKDYKSNKLETARSGCQCERLDKEQPSIEGERQDDK